MQISDKLITRPANANITLLVNLKSQCYMKNTKNINIMLSDVFMLISKEDKSQHKFYKTIKHKHAMKCFLS